MTWNANGSLKQLVVSDQLNSANSQTCNYQQDDFSRIKNVDCGTKWFQDFSLTDVFGNVYKTTSTAPGISFTPTYSTATNRINGGGYAATYDSNGNLTNDGLGKTFSWDADGKPYSVSNGSTTVTVTYDALGRAVENAVGSTYTQIVYGPDGGKLALMNGTSTLVKAFVALPGGGQAVYNSGGLAYYRHADWLGTSRLASTPGRTLYFSGAYAPYGEDYAKTGTTDLSFTGQNQDTMSGLYDFLYRRYSPVQGRWMSPDPAGIAAVDPTNPQTWNRYAYVINNPVNFVDPLGLQCYTSGGGPPEEIPEQTHDLCTIIGGTWIDNPVTTVDVTEPSSPDNLIPDAYNPNIDPKTTDAANNGRSCLAGAGPLAVGQSRCTDPCFNSTLTAAGIDARQQIATAQTYIGWSRYFGYGDLIGYFNAVHTGGPNDIKNLPGHSGQNPIDVDAGNISFGITCPYGAGFCQSAAGLAQTLGGHPNFNGTLATGFDTPSDNAGIQIGQAMRAAGCHE